jgi:hypothetical protein
MLHRFGVGEATGDFGLLTPGRSHVEVFSPQSCDCREASDCGTLACMRGIKPGLVVDAIRHLVGRERRLPRLHLQTA